MRSYRGRAFFTFRYDLIRSALLGVQQSWVHTLGLVVLVKYFEGSDLMKSIIFSSSFLGMMISAFYGAKISRWISRKSSAVSLPILLSAVFMFLNIFASDMWYYSILLVCAFTLLPLHLPIMSSIYHDNFDSYNRGLKLSYSVILTQGVSLIFTYLSGLLLDHNLEYFRVLSGVAAVGLIISAWFSFRIPSRALAGHVSHSVLGAFRWLYKDPLFGYMILVWFIFGFANLWVMPMRVKYLTEELALPPSQIALIYGVIPELMRFLFTPLWAWLFDRINFVVLRMLLNVFLMLGIFLYFITRDVLWIVLGSACFGIGFAGGRIAWTLWTTRMVPADRTADYMAVHVAMTGFRGCVGPYLGFLVLAYFQTFADGYQTMGIISSSMIAVSILMLAPMIQHASRRT